jgi:hypothetical protein
VAGSAVTAGRYAVGVIALLLTLAPLVIAAVALRQRWMPDWYGAPARLAEAVLASALLIGLLELFGAIRLFRLLPIVLTAVLVGWAVTRAAGGISRPRPGHVNASAPTAMTAAAIVAAAVVMAEWAAPTAESYTVGIRTIDSLWYHLPWAASFAQTGQVTSLRFTDVEYLTAFYPATAELFHGLGIVMLGRDTLSPGLNLVWLALTLLAGYCIGRPRGAQALTLTGTALALGTPMFALSQAGSAANDVVGVFFLLAAVALVVAADSQRPPQVLAAVAAGLAIGVKLSMLAPVAALTVGAIAIAPRGRRSATAAVWLGALFVAGGFWYVRNLIAVGNPLPWLGIPGLSTPAAPLQQHTGFSVAHYLGTTHLYTSFFGPGLKAGLGPWWPAVLTVAVVGPLLCLLAGAGRTVRMLGLVALASLVGYLLTPETAAGPAGDPSGFAFNLRYAAPALTLSLAVFPLAPALDGPRRRAVTLGALLVLLAGTVAQGRLWPTQYVGDAIAFGAATGIVALALVWWRRAPTVPRRAVLAAAAVLALAAVTVGYFGQRHYLRGRFAFQPGVSYLANVWARFRTVRDARVGLAGTFGGFFSYPLYGLDSSNRVEYVAVRGPHGSFTPIASCVVWRTAVDAARLRYVVTTPSRDPWHPKHLTPSPEGAWTGSDPAARVVYSRRALGQPITVYKLDGPLNPAACG